MHFMYAYYSHFQSNSLNAFFRISRRCFQYISLPQERLALPQLANGSNVFRGLQLKAKRRYTKEMKIANVAQVCNFIAAVCTAGQETFPNALRYVAPHYFRQVCNNESIISLNIRKCRSLTRIIRKESSKSRFAYLIVIKLFA